MGLNSSDTAITTVENVNYCCIIHVISKSEAIHLVENSVLDDRGYMQKCISKKSILKIESASIILTIPSKQKYIYIETENILIDEKNYKNLTIWFTRYAHSKLIKILSLYYLELIAKFKSMKEKILEIELPKRL